MAVKGAPQTIGSYRVEREIGRGGMGVVYLARDTKLDRDVAIKALPSEFTSDQGKLARFEREAKILASLNHPNIAAVYALEEHGGGQYLVLELIEGRMLDAVLSDGPMPLDHALDVCRQIALAIEAAHHRDVMHRDLKPSNVGVKPDGLVKVLDFGLAKSTVADTAAADATTVTVVPGRTIHGMILGTPGYMSPEQARGVPVDKRTDVWSFGCILYECLCGRPAFSGGSVNDVIATTATEEPGWESLPADTPAPIRELLVECLNKEPATRLGHITEARTRIEAVIGGGPAARARVRRPDVPNNLPTQLTSFVGRTKEIADSTTLLADTRLLTLTGAGGCGKTRLACEIADGLLGEHADGVWFADLAPLTDPALVVQSLATVLGVKEQPGEALSDTVVDHFKDKTALVLLDNCEHVLDAGADLADTLLRGCPELRVVATSREGLGIAGETTYRVPSLSFPDPDQSASAAALKEFEAVQLFVDRAKAAKPDFDLTDANAVAVSEICRRLDGIPLAIELAAARVRALAVDEIARRLEDSFRILTGGSRTALPRQQTLRATIEWSYSLLSEKEKALLRRLSVFAGGWTLEAAEKVCSDDAVIEVKEED